MADGGEAVGHNQAGARLHERVEGILDELLGLGVDAGGRFIQHEEHVGILGYRPGQDEQLLLPQRQSPTPLLQHGVVALGQVSNEGLGIHHAGGTFDIFPRHAGIQKGNVLEHGAGINKRLLQDDTDPLAQVFLAEAAYVDPINRDGTFLDVVKTSQQTDQGALACPRGADHRDRFAATDLDVEVPHNPVLILVGEPDMLEPDVALYPFAADGLSGVLNVFRRIEQPEDPLGGCHGLLKRAGLVGQRPQGTKKFADVGEISHQDTQRHVSGSVEQ